MTCVNVTKRCKTYQKNVYWAYKEHFSLLYNFHLKKCVLGIQGPFQFNLQLSSKKNVYWAYKDHFSLLYNFHLKKMCIGHTRTSSVYSTTFI